jgi:hypothetical protein
LRLGQLDAIGRKLSGWPLYQHQTIYQKPLSLANRNRIRNVICLLFVCSRQATAFIPATACGWEVPPKSARQSVAQVPSKFCGKSIDAYRSPTQVDTLSA